MPDQREALERACLDYGLQVSVVLLDVVAVPGAPGAVAMAALVERQDPVAVVEAPAEVVPDVGMQAHPVQQHDRLGVRAAPLEVVQPHASALYMVRSMLSCFDF